MPLTDRGKLLRMSAVTLAIASYTVSFRHGGTDIVMNLSTVYGDEVYYDKDGEILYTEDAVAYDRNLQGMLVRRKALGIQY